VLGLFCSGNFVFGDAQRAHLAKVGGFSWEEVRKVNIKETLTLHLTSGEVKSIPLEELFSIRRYACQFCADYSNELADLSFGGIGAAEGWTTVISRTPLGRASLADARSAGIIEEVSHKDNPSYATDALAVVRKWSAKKKKSAPHPPGTNDKAGLLQSIEGCTVRIITGGIL
jgi:coenzyme F420 hydrogenase subunit beta